jgi:hypothetical protein
MARSTAGLLAAAYCSKALEQALPTQPQSAATSPEETTGGVRPLLVDNTARPTRYMPDGSDFVIRNGRELFNRPLYGSNNAFRVDAGDLPEFSLYLPGHGGNLRVGISSPSGSKWLLHFEEIVARYRPGRMLYKVSDPILGSGALHLEVFTQGEGSGLHLRAEASDIPANVSLLWAFGGVSGRKGKRGGDIGCESEPVASFFQLRPEECRDNRYEINARSSGDEGAQEARRSAVLHSPAASLLFNFSAGADLRIADASAWNAGWPQLMQSAVQPVSLPVLIGSAPLSNTAPSYIGISRTDHPSGNPQTVNIADAFATRSKQLAATAKMVQVTTPDPHINAFAGALCIASDAIWDTTTGCVMHGAVAWRVPLAGWRGPYALTSMGQHDSMRQHVRHWIARQNNLPLGSNESPAIGAPDPGSHLSRKENTLHSRGDLSHNHYDMNLVFFDALLRHLLWTGDLSFAREIWPAFVLHLEWERRLFRRTYTLDGQELFLYEAYACIWASDNLQYNGGGAAHSSAYNYYANRSAAMIAGLIGEDATPYEKEAALVLEGMLKLLWLPDQGAFGESKDILGPQTVYTSPAIWTVYHAIDSEVPTRRQAWQMCAERLSALKRVPVHGEGVPEGNWFMLSCSDWLPYMWSLNLLVLAENMHAALALWQAGMSEEAFELFKGSIIDSMFQGLCPGNFHMSSELDVHRQESQRDFGDPIGISSRALVEGLFGLKPDLLNNILTIQPGFPGDWDHASLHHPDVDIVWRRHGLVDSFEITSRFVRATSLRLLIPAHRTGRPSVVIDGVAVETDFDPEAVGIPILRVLARPASHWKIEVSWQGRKPTGAPKHRRYRMGERPSFLSDIVLSQIDDPQNALKNGHTDKVGFHVIFVRMHEESCRWWMPISFTVANTLEPPQRLDRLVSGFHIETIDLSSKLKHNIDDIFRRSYSSPRSPYCSLAIPEQGAGAWAAFDLEPVIDDTGLRSCGGTLQTPSGITFRTPADRSQANCLFLSYWQQDIHSVEIPLTGQATRISLLMAGTTFPQCSRMDHGLITIRYVDGSSAKLALKNPDNWWPIEQDYLLDDYLFVSSASMPQRVDLRSGETRQLDPLSFRGKGKSVPGGTANIMELTLDPTKTLASLQIEVSLYGVVVAVLGATLVR